MGNCGETMPRHAALLTPDWRAVQLQPGRHQPPVAPVVVVRDGPQKWFEGWLHMY